MIKRMSGGNYSLHVVCLKCCSNPAMRVIRACGAAVKDQMTKIRFTFEYLHMAPNSHELFWVH